MEKVPVSVVVPVKNEAANLPLCLESLRDFDEVVVVDSGSTDATAGIAAQYGRPVLNFCWDRKFPKKRNWVLRNHSFKYPWVLFLDADERVTEAFVAELRSVLPDTPHHAFWIGYRNWFLGRLLKHGDPMRKTVLLRVGHGEYEQIPDEGWCGLDMEIHEQLVVDGSVGRLKSKLEHHDKRISQLYYARHNEYASLGARAVSGASKSDWADTPSAVNTTLTCPVFPFFYFLRLLPFPRRVPRPLPGFYFAVGRCFISIRYRRRFLSLNGKRRVRSFCDHGVVAKGRVKAGEAHRGSHAVVESGERSCDHAVVAKKRVEGETG